ncbi:MAG TPA: TonB-dependent receptor [Chitinophaga sp.]|uniref:SusC/RagA family TonB-linked outer membrane protein n=1 Tax=Chitinophaga sp. TaxID=1869181 RepID=UPI002B9B2ED4|nr:TonB-dependent receptor [Chitinophaga sp.]HVI47697.1 TonB-dependent receptor [Chitinophaga sp.]
MSRFFSWLTMLMLLCMVSFAQSKQITGKVTDAKDGSPLPGVTVKTKGAAGGTITAADGAFKLSVPGNVNTLVFTFVGYADQEVSIAGKSSITVALSAGNKDISEIVVVGYGTQLKREVTGSIAKINAKEIEDVPVPSFESAIQGKAAGVVIESGSGRLGQGLKVRVRGTSSISASNQPLYIVDGMPVESSLQTDDDNEITNPLTDINPNDIESVEVLKDAAATAIYGARASNGVVLVTTKKGKLNQRTVFNLDVNTGWATPTMKRGFLNAKQYVELIEEAAVNDGKTDFRNHDTGYGSEPEAIAAYKKSYESDILDNYSLGTDWRNGAVNTNWENEVYRHPARSNQINLSATGGSEKTRFFVSGFYSSQEAIVINNKFTRYGARLSLDHAATDKLNVGINLSVNRSQLDRISQDNEFSSPSQLVAQIPISPIIDPNTGKLNSKTLYDNGLFDAQYDSDKQISFRTLGNVYATYNFLPWLNFRSELGADILNMNEDYFKSKLSLDGAGIGKGQSINAQSVSLNTNNFFTITPSLGSRHKLSMVLGTSYLQNENRNNITQGESYPSDAVKNLSGATAITTGIGKNFRYTFLSYFFRANYAYNEKYLASFSIRTDGSSRFGPNNRYGVFPAGSLGWVISQEDFLKESKAISLLKLRASAGLTGNAEIGEGRFLSLYKITNYPDLPGFQPSQLANPDLRWEKTFQADVGLEFGFLENRISGEVDVYKKNTSDLLLDVNIPLTTGYGIITQNLGKMENKGIEFSLNTRNLEGEFKWTTSFNIGFNKNKITNLQGQVIKSGSQRAVEGQSIGTFYMPRFIGADKETGDALYMDSTGKPTNNINRAPEVVVGSSNPDFTGGFTNNFSYKGFDLSVFFTFVHGNKIFNSAGTFQTAGFGNGYDNQTLDILNRWQKPGDITDVPRVSITYPTGYQTSSRYIYNGSYIRLKNVTLSYNLPKRIIEKLKIQGIKVYAAGYNLWTKTDYISDPEVSTTPLAGSSNTTRNISSGVDRYTIPQAKTYVVGLNVRF